MSVDDTVKKIDKIVHNIAKHWDDPDNLTLDGLKLAILKSKLGQAYVEARDTVRNLETILKFTQSTKKRELTATGMAVNKAELQVVEETHGDQLELNEAKKAEDLLKIKRDDVAEMVDIIRSRASFIKGEVK